MELDYFIFTGTEDHDTVNLLVKSCMVGTFIHVYMHNLKFKLSF